MAIKFLITNPNDDVQTKELQRSTALAHASRVGHQRKRERLRAHSVPKYAAHRGFPRDGEIEHEDAISDFIEEDEIAQCRLIRLLIKSHVYSDGLRTDPFHTMPGGKRYWPIIDYWTQVMIPSNRVVHELVGVVNIYTTYFLDLLQDDLLFDASIATVIASLPAVRRPTFSNCDLLRHRGKVLAALIRIMSEESSTTALTKDEHIITLAYLCTLERRLGNTDAYHVHAKSLQRLVAARGGVDNLGHGGLVKARLLQWDTFWGMTSGQTLFPEARRLYRPVYPSRAYVLQSKEYMDLPGGFVRLAVEDGLPMDVLDLLVKVNAAWKRRDHVVTNDNKAQISCDHQPYSDFCDAIPCLGLTEREIPYFPKLLCIAILLFCSNGFTSDRSVTNLGTNCKKKLLADLPRLQLTGINEARKVCIFWMIIVSIDAWLEAPSMLLSPAVKQLVEVSTAIGSDWSLIDKQQTMEAFFHSRALLHTLQHLP